MAGEALNWPWIYLWPRLLQCERQLARVERGESCQCDLGDDSANAKSRPGGRGGERLSTVELGWVGHRRLERWATAAFWGGFGRV